MNETDKTEILLEVSLEVDFEEGFDHIIGLLLSKLQERDIEALEKRRMRT